MHWEIKHAHYNLQKKRPLQYGCVTFVPLEVLGLVCMCTRVSDLICTCKHEWEFSEGTLDVIFNFKFVRCCYLPRCPDTYCSLYTFYIQELWSCASHAAQFNGFSSNNFFFLLWTKKKKSSWLTFTMSPTLWFHPLQNGNAEGYFFVQNRNKMQKVQKVTFKLMSQCESMTLSSDYLIFLH